MAVDSGIPSKLFGKVNYGVLSIDNTYRFVYERVRQALLLVRAIRRFQKANNCTAWPVVLAGGKSPHFLLLFSFKNATCNHGNES